MKNLLFLNRMVFTSLVKNLILCLEKYVVALYSDVQDNIQELLHIILHRMTTEPLQLVIFSTISVVNIKETPLHGAGRANV